MVAEHGTDWNLSPCLIDLMAETDRLFPDRSTVSDGSIGDPAHQARVSDHNPKDPRPPGWVDAVDITDDDASGCDVGRLVHHLVASRDRRVKYLIHKGTIWKAYPSNGVPAWTPIPYTGPSPHTHHVHVSCLPGERFYTGAWWAASDIVPNPQSDPQPVPVPTPQPKKEDEMLIVKCAGKPTRFLAAPLCPVIDTATEQSLLLVGVKAAYFSAESYDRLLNHVNRSFGEA